MSQISQLEDYINQRRAYQEVSAKAFDINPNWRSETWTRALRNSKKVKGKLKDPFKPPSSKNPIIAYIPTDEPKTPPEPILSDKTSDFGHSQPHLFKPSRITH